MESPQNGTGSGTVATFPGVGSMGYRFSPQSPSMGTLPPSAASYLPLAVAATPGQPSENRRATRASSSRSSRSMQCPEAPRFNPGPPAAPLLNLMSPSSPRRTRRQTRASLKAEEEGESRGPPAVFQPPIGSDTVARGTRRRKRKASELKPPPNAKDPPKTEGLKKAANEAKGNNGTSSCCICMTEPDPSEKASINGCEHIFCFGCIEKWSDRENTCPLCKVRFSKIELVNKPPRKKGTRGVRSSKRVKNRDQRTDMAQGHPLQGLFASVVFGSIGIGGNTMMELSSPAVGFGGRSRTMPWASALAASSTAAAAARNSRNASGAAQAAGARSGASIEDSLFSSDDDEAGSDNEVGFDHFVQHIRRHHVRSITARRARSSTTRSGLRFQVSNIDQDMPSLPGMPPLAGPLASMPHYHPPRSYASNMADIAAGHSAANALEIESDSDDEIEVVRVAPAGGS